MKKIKTVMLQVRTCDEEEWFTIGAKETRYTDFIEATREYTFNDFFYTVANERYHNYFKTKQNLFTGIRKVVCKIKNMEMTELSCKKIYIKEKAFEQSLDNITLEMLIRVLPVEDFIEFITDRLKQKFESK